MGDTCFLEDLLPTDSEKSGDTIRNHLLLGRLPEPTGINLKR